MADDKVVADSTEARQQAENGYTKRVVRNGAVDIAVFEQGNPDGETLLLLHGWPDTHHLWDAVVPLLADRFRVVAVDNRGHGESTNPKDFRDFRLTELAADYSAVIDEVSPDRPVHILAHDWGSVAAWELVCRPNAELRIASFTSVSGPSAEHMSTMARRRLARPTPRNVALALGQLGSIGYMFWFMTPVLPKAAFAAGMTAQRWREGLAAIEGADPENISLAPSFSDDIGNGLRIYRANAIPALLHPSDRFTSVPVQIVVGTRDPAIRQSSYDEEDRWAPRVWRRVVSGGHWLPFSHPGMLANATVELIDAVSGKEPARGLRRAEMGRERDEFTDQLVVITGGGSGIGRETALAFARKGAEIVVSDRSLASAKETVALVGELGGVAHAYQLDVSDEDAVNEHAGHVLAAHGVPDVLVNNAGIGQAGDFLKTPSEEFRRVLDVNLYGVVNSCRAFAGAMVARGEGGHIVNLSSMAAYSAQQSFSAYSTSKSAVFMFSDCLRAELAAADIGVSTICPGIVHTNIVATTTFSGISAEEEARRQQRFDKLYKLRGYTPDKVADRIVSAVRKGKDIVPVTPEAHLQYHANRLVPALTRTAAKRAKLIR